jgi:hypothetical protein
MSLVKLCAYKRRRNGLFCNSSTYARTSAHLTWVALRVCCDLCTSVDWRSLGCGSFAHWNVCESVGWRSLGCGSLAPSPLLSFEKSPYEQYHLIYIPFPLIMFYVNIDIVDQLVSWYIGTTLCICRWNWKCICLNILHLFFCQHSYSLWVG